MSAPMEIPGYYYDPTKKKYFKIQRSGATPADSPYSSDNIRKRKLEEEAVKRARHLTLQQKSLAHRAPTLRDPLLGGQLQREFGYDARAGRDTAAAVAHDLGMRRKAIVRGWSGKTIMESRQGVPESINTFDWDPVSRELFVPMASNTFWSAQEETYSKFMRRNYGESASSMTRPRMNEVIPKFNWKDISMMGAQGSPMTSITIADSARLLLATWTSAFYQVSKLAEVNQYNGYSAAQIDESILYATRSEVSEEEIQTTIAAPKSSPYIFAIGSSHAVTLIHPQEPVQSMTDTRQGSIFALSFLSQCPSVLLAGTRSGSIQIKDLRERSRQSNLAGKYPTNLLFHPSTVTHIKQISDHRIVVAGLRSSLHQYDLRFTPVSNSKVWDKSLGDASPFKASESVMNTVDNSYRHDLKQHITAPFLTYENYSNANLIRIGFDVDVEAGIVAAAGDDRTVRVWDVHSGEELLTKRKAALGGRKIYPEVVKALKFVSDRGNHAPKSLWVANGTEIKRFAW